MFTFSFFCLFVVPLSTADCEKDGKTYSNGDKLVDPETPCTVCYCQGKCLLLCYMLFWLYGHEKLAKFSNIFFFFSSFICLVIIIAGEILCSPVTCFHRDDCSPKYISGVCCPEYDNCPGERDYYLVS